MLMRFFVACAYFIAWFFIVTHGAPSLSISWEENIPHTDTTLPYVIEAPFYYSQRHQLFFSRESVWNDAHLERFVTKTIPLNNRDYRPANLTILSGAYIDPAGRLGYIRSDAHEALLWLARAFYSEFQTPLVAISGYRSADYQKRLWDLGKCTPTLCAPPGYSEHQLGLAIDIFDASTKEDYIKNKRLARYIHWIQNHAHTYGYIQSYQRGPETDGYDIEPWHWRYIGSELATRLYERRFTYSEYIEWESFVRFWQLGW